MRLARKTALLKMARTTKTSLRVIPTSQRQVPKRPKVLRSTKIPTLPLSKPRISPLPLQPPSSVQNQLPNPFPPCPPPHPPLPSAPLLKQSPRKEAPTRKSAKFSPQPQQQQTTPPPPQPPLSNAPKRVRKSPPPPPPTRSNSPS